MGPLSIVLAPFTGAHYPLNIGNRCWLVESLAESVPNQGSRRGVVSADPTVDVHQQLVAMLDRQCYRILVWLRL
jgi:hypothetical protein